MAIKAKLQQKIPKVTLDLSGPDGNIFVVMNLANQLGHQLGYDSEKIINQMKQGNYKHAINVFESYFGDYVDMFVNSDSDLLN
ncbi:hypothetical protein FCV82_02185 [Vibrio breoganii]|uniref:hypothetical protein n=1 Tax=Vibrio breoganii TaxID=553239 RepID=UPI000C827094|nr:hypothetical protein [Vibrio breoganii]PMN67106.1 hypothetical protein BCT28_03890 [Vibrio breoganii]PMO82917.1 hypothetical protein BCT00_06710 [Vibrio breoganii]TKF90401.1 hypothetical protein FCV82_02185 [Vibrio breoganii]